MDIDRVVDGLGGFSVVGGIARFELLALKTFDRSGVNQGQYSRPCPILLGVSLSVIPRLAFGRT